MRTLSEALADSQYCDTAKRIILKQGNEACTDGMGGVTSLYWHISECLKCNELLHNKEESK